MFAPKDLIGDKLGMVTETAPTEVIGEFETQNGMAGWRKPGTEFFNIHEFIVVATMHIGQQSIYHIASPDGIVFMNLQYVQIRFGLEQAPKTYFNQYSESELGGRPIYNTYCGEHGAFATFEADGILYTLSGGIDGDNSMENLFTLCETIING